MIYQSVIQSEPHPADELTDFFVDYIKLFDYINDKLLFIIS